MSGYAEAVGSSGIFRCPLALLLDLEQPGCGDGRNPAHDQPAPCFDTHRLVQAFERGPGHRHRPTDRQRGPLSLGFTPPRQGQSAHAEDQRVDSSAVIEPSDHGESDRARSGEGDRDPPPGSETGESETEQPQRRQHVQVGHIDA